MAFAYERHKINVDEYHRMAQADIFPSDARIELIDGELIETVAPMDPPHGSGITVLNRTLVRRAGNRATVRCQLPVTLGDYSEPQPDFALVRNDERDYRDRHPGPRDILLLIEIADATRDDDRRIKIPLYGRFGITESWLVDLIDDCLIVFRDSSERGYESMTRFCRGETIVSLGLPDERFTIEEILPPPSL
jgi:Uma2 family endonuclease